MYKLNGSYEPLRSSLKYLQSNVHAFYVAPRPARFLLDLPQVRLRIFPVAFCDFAKV
jgi:hypothetical protein